MVQGQPGPEGATALWPPAPYRVGPTKREAEAEAPAQVALTEGRTPGHQGPAYPSSTSERAPGATTVAPRNVRGKEK